MRARKDLAGRPTLGWIGELALRELGPEADDIIDLGCGEGDFSWYARLQAPNTNILCLDRSDCLGNGPQGSRAALAGRADEEEERWVVPGMKFQRCEPLTKGLKWTPGTGKARRTLVFCHPETRLSASVAREAREILDRDVGVRSCGSFAWAMAAARVAEEGRAVVILPHRALCSAEDAPLREALLRKRQLERVIYLPVGSDVSPRHPECAMLVLSHDNEAVAFCDARPLARRDAAGMAALESEDVDRLASHRDDDCELGSIPTYLFLDELPKRGRHPSLALDPYSARNLLTQNARIEEAEAAWANGGRPSAEDFELHWPILLGDLPVDVATGYGRSARMGELFTERTDGAARYLTQEDFDADGTLVNGAVRYVHAPETRSGRPLLPGDVLLPRMGPKGQARLVRETREPLVASDYFYVIRCRGDLDLGRFLWAWITSPAGAAALRSRCTDQASQFCTVEDLLSLPVPDYLGKDFGEGLAQHEEEIARAREALAAAERERAGFLARVFGNPA